MNNWNLSRNDIKNLSLVTGIMGFLSVYGFNCAPPSFQAADNGNLALSSTGTGGPILTPEFDNKPIMPQALLTSEQIYQSLMGMTEQTPLPSNTQIQEFDRRSGSFPVYPGLDLVNSPMLLALASFSGETCSGLFQREMCETNQTTANCAINGTSVIRPNAATAKKYFTGMAFNAQIGTISQAAFEGVVSNLTTSFWGRAPNAEELTAFYSFRTDFVAAVPAAQVTDPNHTRRLAISACAAVISSFEVFTY